MARIGKGGPWATEDEVWYLNRLLGRKDKEALIGYVNSIAFRHDWKYMDRKIVEKLAKSNLRTLNAVT